MADTYTTEALLGRIRVQLDDRAQPYLVSDDDILSALDQAQNEFVEQTLCLTDATSFSVTTEPGIAFFVVDPMILKLRAAYSETQQRDVQVVSRQYFESLGRRRGTTGDVSYILTDTTTGRGEFIPTPVRAEVIRFDVYLHPTPLVHEGIDPSIPDRFRRHLIAGAMSILYGIADSQIYDAQAQSKWEMKWQMALRDSLGKVMRDQRGPAVVRFNSGGVW